MEASVSHKLSMGGSEISRDYQLQETGLAKQAAVFPTLSKFIIRIYTEITIEVVRIDS